MIQEQFRQEGQVLAVYRVLISVNLKHSHCIFLVAVNLITRRMEKGAVLAVAFELGFEGEEAEAEVADVEAVKVVVVDGVGAEVPA